MLTVDKYLGDHVTNPVYASELTDEMRENAAALVGKINAALEAFGEDRRCNSGWRPRLYNKLVPGAAVRSHHITCNAADMEDQDGALRDWCMDNLATLELIGLWMEHPSATKGWCHLQQVPPRSGRRVFYP